MGATITYTPDQHDCYIELATLGVPGGKRLPVGTTARCDCGKDYVMRDIQLDGPCWQLWMAEPLKG